jgi:hypothetical protein
MTMIKFRAIEHHKNSSIKPIIDFGGFDAITQQIQKGTTIICDGIFDELPGMYRVTIKKLADNLKELSDDNT